MTDRMLETERSVVMQTTAATMQILKRRMPWRCDGRVSMFSDD